MHIPAWSVLPDSTLAPPEVLAKFSSAAMAGLRGLGAQVCDESGCYDDGTTDTGNTVVTLPYPAGNPAPSTPPLGTGPCTCTFGFESCCPGASSFAAATPDTTVATSTGALAPGYTIPNQSSAAWANVAAALVKGGMTLAQIQSIQPGTVVSANGAILRQATGLAVPVPGATNLGLGLSTTGSSS